MVKIEIENERDNVLLKRKELRCIISFDNEATPTREQVRELVAKNYGADKTLVVVDSSRQETGKHVAKTYVKIYKDKDSALLYEPDYELFRNGLKSKEEGAS